MKAYLIDPVKRTITECDVGTGSWMSLTRILDCHLLAVAFLGNGDVAYYPHPRCRDDERRGEVTLTSTRGRVTQLRGKVLVTSAEGVPHSTPDSLREHFVFPPLDNL